MTGSDQKQQMQQLEVKIAAVKKSQERGPVQEDHYSQAQHAWRMVIELVAGLGIGFGIGYSLDRFFGTLPLFLVLFVLLGLAAGIKTMIRSADEVQKKQLAGQEGPTAKNEGDTRG